MSATDSMKRKRHTPEEIIKKLRTAEVALASGKNVEEACRMIAVSMATYQRWKSQYSGVKKDTLKRLKELEKENARLKRRLCHPLLGRVCRRRVTGCGALPQGCLGHRRSDPQHPCWKGGQRCRVSNRPFPSPASSRPVLRISWGRRARWRRC